MRSKPLFTWFMAALLLLTVTACRNTNKSAEQSSTLASAQDTSVAVVEGLPEAPQCSILDMAGVLGKEDSLEIVKKIIELDSLKLAQVAVVITNDLKGMNAHFYATQIGKKWGVGNKETNNGITIVVKTKVDDTPEGKGKAAIATGLGMEKIIDNDMCLRMIEEEMVPKFKQNKYGEGIEDFLDKIKDILTGDKD